MRALSIDLLVLPCRWLRFASYIVDVVVMVVVNVVIVIVLCVAIVLFRITTRTPDLGKTSALNSCIREKASGFRHLATYDTGELVCEHGCVLAAKVRRTSSKCRRNREGQLIAGQHTTGIQLSFFYNSA